MAGREGECVLFFLGLSAGIKTKDNTSGGFGSVQQELGGQRGGRNLNNLKKIALKMAQAKAGIWQ